MTNKFLLLILAAFTNAILLEEVQSSTMSDAQAELFIYGTITTTDDQIYTGQIRWGREEAFWFDYFNSSKPENENLELLTNQQLEVLNNKDKRSGAFAKYSWSMSWGDDNTHTFVCQFGDIKSIRPTRGERLVLTLKNGHKIKLEGGSNDIGAKVRVHDEEFGTLKIDWDRIELVEFSATPVGLQSAWGRPLYGEVVTTDEVFTGYLQWDHDERLSFDELNGECDAGELDIPFGNIKTISKSKRGSNVKMKSGRTLMLRGTNDVNYENKGIIVNMVNMGRVDICWDDFESMTFIDAPEVVTPSYDSYGQGKPLVGTLTTVNGRVLKGEIIYDLDEAYDLELLDGNIADIEYFIPFRNIKTINPINDNNTIVTMWNGQSLKLGDKVDVNSRNDGMLIKKANEDYHYIPWKEVSLLEFDTSIN